MLHFRTIPHLKCALLIALFLGFSAITHSQPHYTIDISKQDYPIKENFLKMGSNRAPNGTTLSYNNRYLVKNGKPWFPIMGEMHFGQRKSGLERITNNCINRNTQPSS